MVRLLDTRILNLDGYMKHKELDWLFKTAQSIAAGGIIVEIGAFCGRSTAALCQGANWEKIVVAVDPFDDEEMATRPDWNVDVSDMFAQFTQNMAELAYFPAVLRMESVKAAGLLADKSVAMVFIDGDHSDIAADLDAWGSKIRQGGLLAGHDWTNARYPIKKEVLARYPHAENVVNSVWKVQM